jgi:hypothetical protein
MTVDEFLLAQLDELEAEAHHQERLIAEDYYDTDGELPEMLAAFGGPRYVLAECRAKRKIVEQLRKAQAKDTVAGQTTAFILLRVVTTLAQPLAEHPDFDPEWKTP